MTFDVSRFYESTTYEQVRSIYKRFFHFPDEVVTALSKLTTVDGHLPRGASTSSYLANLVFFDDEEALVTELATSMQIPLRYSRWVDDIAITSRLALTDEAIAQVTERVAGMLTRHGLRFTREKGVLQSKRRKRRVVRRAGFVTIHNIQICGSRMSVASHKRNELRRSVYYLSKKSQCGPLDPIDLAALRSAQSMLGYVQQFHPGLATLYRPTFRDIWKRHKDCSRAKD